MKIVQGFPPNFEAIKTKFNPHANTVFTYGECIYIGNIKSTAISEDLLTHEDTHRKQQGEDPGKWWDEYIADPIFRLHMEIQAYQKQYQFFCQHNGRQMRRRFLRLIAQDLAGHNYGNIISYDKAYELIQSNQLSTSPQPE